MKNKWREKQWIDIQFIQYSLLKMKAWTNCEGNFYLIKGGLVYFGQNIQTSCREKVKDINCIHGSRNFEMVLVYFFVFFFSLNVPSLQIKIIQQYRNVWNSFEIHFCSIFYFIKNNSSKKVESFVDQQPKYRPIKFIKDPTMTIELPLIQISLQLTLFLLILKKISINYHNITKAWEITFKCLIYVFICYTLPYKNKIYVEGWF